MLSNARNLTCKPVLSLPKWVQPFPNGHTWWSDRRGPFGPALSGVTFRSAARVLRWSLQPFAGGHEVQLADDVVAVEGVLSVMM